MTLRSRPTSKNIRLGMPEGVAEIFVAPQRVDGRVTVTIAHARLGSTDEVLVWKEFWGDWLGALDEA